MVFVTWKRIAAQAHLFLNKRSVFWFLQSERTTDKQVTEIRHKFSSWSNQSEVVSEFVPNRGQGVCGLLRPVSDLQENKTKNSAGLQAKRTHEHPEKDHQHHVDRKLLLVCVRIKDTLSNTIMTTHKQCLVSFSQSTYLSSFFSYFTKITSVLKS